LSDSFVSGVSDNRAVTGTGKAREVAAERSVWAPLSAGVIAVCLLAAALHVAPVAAAKLNTPRGWTFTGNTSVSPDYMAYRIWMRESQESGPLVANTFTSEHNTPHLPVLTYWAFGKVAGATGVRPEVVYELAGCAFAFALTWLVWSAVAHFGRSRREKLWAFAAIMLAGGLASHLRLMDDHRIWFRRIPGVSMAISSALDDTAFLEDYRGGFVVSTLPDTHFLIVWTAVLLSTLMAYQTLRRPTMVRWSVTLFLFGLTTLLHIYEGAVLIAILTGTCLVLRVKGLCWRRALVLLIACSAVVSAVVLWQIWLWRGAGLPLPVWGEKTFPSIVVLAGYPLALALILWGGLDFARRADLADSFLIGWALGLLVMMLSGPLFPYPARGVVSASIPLSIIAARIYFRDRARLPVSHALVAVVVLFAAPIHVADIRARSLRFSPTKTHIWVNDHQMRLINYLKHHASSEDVLLVDATRPPWRTDDRWLAPEYPGRLYAGHFFLTVDYRAKRDRVIDFYSNVNPERRAAFLREARIRWIFAGPENDLAGLRSIPGVVVRGSFGEGSLLEFMDGAG
jgi:hypothetical protein